jgi:hypothetical protein
MSISPGLRYIRDVSSYSFDVLQKEDLSNISLKDILGFKPPDGANVFLNYVGCIPLEALFPVYDTIIAGMPKAKNIAEFERKTRIKFNDFIALSQSGKLLPYFNTDCFFCLEELAPIIQQLVDNNVRFFLGGTQSVLLMLKAAGTKEIDFNLGEKLVEDFTQLASSKKEISELQMFRIALKEKGYNPRQFEWATTVRICSTIKPTSEYIKQIIEIGKKGATPEELMGLCGELSMTPSMFLARAFNSILSTNVGCRHIISEKVKKDRSDLQVVDSFELQFIEKKLRIAISDKIPLADYLSIFDSKTTAALRRITRQIISEARLKSNSVLSLQNTLDEYNEQVEDLVKRSTKRAKLVFATSDIVRSNSTAIKMALQGVTQKYLNTPEKAWDCIVLPDKYRTSTTKWLGGKALKLESLLSGVSPDIIQLYKIRTCLETKTR